MLKKIVVIFVIFFILFATTQTFGAATDGNAILESEQATELVKINESMNQKINESIEKYGSVPYGIAAYILNGLRIYSIPFCFIGIAIGSIYQYVIGIRKMDVRDKGFGLIITFVTILVICQVLPLIFTVVVKGWRG